MALVTFGASVDVGLGSGDYNVNMTGGGAVVDNASQSANKATTADTDVGTVQTDMTAAFTAYDIFGNALVAITGDTYSDTTHLWTTAGSGTLTHAQVATLMALANTAITDFVTAQTAATAAKAATAAAKTAATLVTNSFVSDVTIVVNSTNITNRNQFMAVVRRLLAYLGGMGVAFSK